MNKGKLQRGQASWLVLPNTSLNISSRNSKSPESSGKREKHVKSKSFGVEPFEKKKRENANLLEIPKHGTPATNKDHNCTTLRWKTLLRPRKENSTQHTFSSRKCQTILTTPNGSHSKPVFEISEQDVALSGTENDELTTNANSTNLLKSAKENSICSPFSTLTKNSGVILFDCTSGSIPKNNRSPNFRNKLHRELANDSKILHKLSRSTKLSGTINKEKKSAERQLTQHLKNLTMRRKYTQSNTDFLASTNAKTEKLIKKPLLRRNMPDFSAIHHQHFGKMESIVEYVERKAQRAIELKTSTAKKNNPDRMNEISAKKPIVENLQPQKVNSKSRKTNKCVTKLETKFDKEQSRIKAAKKNIKIFPETDVSKVNDLNNRLMENRELYKAKKNVSGRIRENNVEKLQGVRSNRKFELQMKFRNNRN